MLLSKMVGLDRRISTFIKPLGDNDEKPFEFASEKRKRISKEIKERYGFSHGCSKKKHKKKNK